MRWSNTRRPGRLRPPEPARAWTARVTVAHLYQMPRRAIRQRCQQSPPPTTSSPLTCWARLPAANLQRLLYLLIRLVERLLTQAPGTQHGLGEVGPPYDDASSP